MNLSETIQQWTDSSCIDTDDVRKFMKELLDNPSHQINCSVSHVHRIINELAGEDLK